jgi:hypothetical protein
MHKQQLDEIRARFQSRHKDSKSLYYYNRVGQRAFRKYAESDMGALLDYVGKLQARIEELECELEVACSHFGEDA